MPTQSANCLTETKKKEAEEFLVEYNPSKQSEIVQSKYAFSDDFDTIASLSRSLGNKVSSAWLFVQISDLNEFCGAKAKMSSETIKSFASIIATKYTYLTIGELMYFFFNCKAGEYGEFFGVVDPVKIGTMLKEFLKKRHDIRERIERKRNADYIKEKSKAYIEDLALARSKGYKSILEMSVAEGRISKESIELARKLGIGGLPDED